MFSPTSRARVMHFSGCIIVTGSFAQVQLGDGPSTARSFFHSYILCGTCTVSARQSIVNASKRALHCLTVMAGYPVWHTPASGDMYVSA